MGSVGEQEYDVIVVGGGFSGCYQLHNLREAGFNVHLFDAGAELGGIWYWNCYPGARVDTEVPTYQFTAPETWQTWEWKERFPGRDTIQSYFKHVDKVWDLSRDVSYNSRVNTIQWDENNRQYIVEVGGSAAGTYRSQFIILCTGFAAKPYLPPFRNIDAFKGEMYHTALYPQQGVNLEGRRVAVIGTGASGVQVIQSVGPIVSHLTVFQRTPNPAIPMSNPDLNASQNKELKENFDEVNKLIHSTFAGFDYDFAKGSAFQASPEERKQLYEKLFNSGGLHFWLGTWMDILFDKGLNDEAYEFWRQKTLPRIKDPKVAELLAPKVTPDPFGTKRVSLEQNYFEVFNQDNVKLISTKENPIEEFTPKGIRTSDGVEHEFDVIIFATGFDAITGSIHQLDLRGIDGISIKDKWKNGTYTNLGMTISGFPNLFFTYGPQGPTAFATGPSSAEAQGEWIVTCIKYMRENGKRTINATADAEQKWRDHVNELGDKGLFKQAKSWYFGKNIPGKPVEALNYMAGLPKYREVCWDSANNGYSGFVLAN